MGVEAFAALAGVDSNAIAVLAGRVARRRHALVVRQDQGRGTFTHFRAHAGAVDAAVSAEGLARIVFILVNPAMATD